MRRNLSWAVQRCQVVVVVILVDARGSRVAHISGDTLSREYCRRWRRISKAYVLLVRIVVMHCSWRTCYLNAFNIEFERVILPEIFRLRCIRRVMHKDRHFTELTTDSASIAFSLRSAESQSAVNFTDYDRPNSLICFVVLV